MGESAGRVVAVIPARYASERFPGKPLALIAGVPMVVRVMENVRAAASIDDVLVAADDERVVAAVESAGGTAVMTAPELPSGSDRVWSVARAIDADIVVNVQGDEPLLPGSAVDALVQGLGSTPAFDVTTPVVSVPRRSASSPDVVTVARDEAGRALYFSRSTVPSGAAHVWKHIGVYAFRRAALERYVEAEPSVLERFEKLEQLRALSIDLRIGAIEVDGDTQAVDRPEHVDAVERALAGATTGQRAVRLVVLDVDGVLTDGRIQYLGDDEQLLGFDVKDGYGIASLLREGIDVAIVSSRDSAALRRRTTELGIRHVRAGVPDKLAALRELCDELGVALNDVCVVGDDDPDVPLMASAGLSAAPVDASAAARSQASIVLGCEGGRGAVRELADRLVAESRGE